MVSCFQQNLVVAEQAFGTFLSILLVSWLYLHCNTERKCNLAHQTLKKNVEPYLWAGSSSRWLDMVNKWTQLSNSEALISGFLRAAEKSGWCRGCGKIVTLIQCVTIMFLCKYSSESLQWNFGGIKAVQNCEGWRIPPTQKEHNTELHST